MARRRARTRSRIVVAFIGWTLLLVVAAVVGGFVWLRTSLPDVDGTVAVAGLRQPASITRDADGIPHIRAASEADAYFALGFVHAQDRLWQMEATRRVGEGRLAEIVGPLGVSTDRFSRVMGFAQLAQANLRALSPEARSAVDAYTAGVNAWIERHRGALPPEFLALHFQPEPWRPEDSLIWGKLMASRLSNWPVLLLRLRLSTVLNPDEMADLFPPYPADAPVTIDDAEERHAAVGGGRVAPRLHAALPFPGGEADVPAEASNAFVLAGTRTSSGSPLLANDPHLAFDAPNLWYLVRIDAPGLTLAGASVPGVPFLVIGHNGHVGWGFTTTGADTDTLVVERSKSTHFTQRAETIAVAGHEPVQLTVRRSEIGPIVSDITPIPGLQDGEVAAVSTPSLRDDDGTVDAFFHLNRAESAEAFREALREFHAPMQNVVFADVDGHIGSVIAGRMPERTPGAPSGLIRDDNGSPSQQPYIPFEELPQTFDPPRGQVVNTNNKVVGADYPYDLGSFWPGVERASRIEQRLAAAPAIDPAGASTIQTDAVSLGARKLLPRLLPFIADAGLDDAAVLARERLNGWDGTMRRDAAEPLIWHAWIRALATSLAATRGHGDDPSLATMIARPEALSRILDAPARWCGQPNDEPVDTCKPLVAGAFATAMNELERTFGNDPGQWRWGAAHRAVFTHRLFASFPVLDRLTTIDVPTDGDDDTVNRGTFASTPRRGSPFYRPPMYPGIHGPGLRVVLDFSDLDRSLFMQATGQSGNPLSPHYRDLTDRWAAGEYVTLGPVDYEQDDIHTLRLVPTP